MHQAERNNIIATLYIKLIMYIPTYIKIPMNSISALSYT